MQDLIKIKYQTHLKKEEKDFKDEKKSLNISSKIKSTSRHFNIKLEPTIGAILCKRCNNYQRNTGNKFFTKKPAKRNNATKTLQSKN